MRLLRPLLAADAIMLVGMYFGLGLGTLCGLSVRRRSSLRRDRTPGVQPLALAGPDRRRLPSRWVTLVHRPEHPARHPTAPRAMQVGPFVFAKYFAAPKKYEGTIGEKADSDRLVEVPETGSKVTSEYRALLPWCEPWVLSPDYERVSAQLPWLLGGLPGVASGGPGRARRRLGRAPSRSQPHARPAPRRCEQVSMINRILAVMWPNITKAVLTKVLNEVAKPQLEKQVFAKVRRSSTVHSSDDGSCGRSSSGGGNPGLARRGGRGSPLMMVRPCAQFPFIEDIVLGTVSMRDSNSWDAWIKDKVRHGSFSQLQRLAVRTDPHGGRGRASILARAGLHAGHGAPAPGRHQELRHDG